MTIQVIRNDTSAHGLRRLHVESDEEIDLADVVSGLPKDAEVFRFKGARINKEPVNIVKIYWKDRPESPAEVKV